MTKHFALNEADKERLEDMLSGLAKEAGFAEAEWYCLADITCGTYMFEPATIRLIHGEVEDAEPSYFEKWEVNRGDILSKLATFDPLGRLAVACRCRSLFDE